MSDGLYIHHRDEHHGLGTRTMTITVDGEEQEWVHADDFMTTQRERDDYRRALALINAWRWSPDFMGRRSQRIDAQLQAVGFTIGDAYAMNSLIADALTWREKGDAVEPYDPATDECPECQAKPGESCIAERAVMQGFPGDVGPCPRDSP